MLNDLPDLVIRMIINKLSTKDLLKLRLVSKKLQLLCDSSRITELVISDVQNGRTYWFSNHKFIDYEYDSVKLSTFLKFRLIFKFENCLKRLHFYLNSFHPLHSSIFDGLNQLEHLEIISKYGSFPRANLNLPKLKIFVGKINLSNLNFNTPNLKKLYCRSLTTGIFKNPELIKSIQYLSLREYERKIENFVNLESLELYYCGIGSAINKEMLNIFTKLKELRIYSRINHLDEDGLTNIERIKRDLMYILKQRLILRRTNLKIYFQDVQIEDRSKIDEFVQKDLKFQIQNYDLLSDYLNDWTINYTELMSIFGHRLENSFFKKYYAINYVKSVGVTNANNFIWFLKGLKCLRRLKLEFTSLDQQFYENLSNNVNHLNEICIEESFENKINYAFILKFKFLAYFKTNQELGESLDLAIRCIKNLKHLRVFKFSFEEYFVKITVLNGFKVYRIICYDLDSFFKVGLNNIGLDDLITALCYLKGTKEEVKMTRSRFKFWRILEDIESVFLDINLDFV